MDDGIGVLAGGVFPGGLELHRGTVNGGAPAHVPNAKRSIALPGWVCRRICRPCLKRHLDLFRILVTVAGLRGSRFARWPASVGPETHPFRRSSLTSYGESDGQSGSRDQGTLPEHSPYTRFVLEAEPM